MRSHSEIRAEQGRPLTSKPASPGDAVLAFLRSATVPFSWRQLVRQFAVAPHEETEFKRLLNKLAAAKQINKLKGKRYTAVPVEVASAAAAVKSAMASTAAQGPVSKDGTLRARVVREGRFLFAVSTEGGSKLKFILPKTHQANAKAGQSVMIQPLGRKGPLGFPSAKVLAGVKNALTFSDVSQAFFKEKGLPIHYPKAAQHEASQAPEPLWEAHRHRLDLRGAHIVTIDPIDAKDHDDAISLERLPGGGWKLGVHIADVAEYVPLDSALDEEALRRGFTQYLPWTAVPMLPQRLSGDLCSLLEDRDRLAFSCLMEISPAGELTRFDFVESFLRVAHFYSYEEAQGLMEEGEPFLGLLSEFTRLLLDKRKEDGYLDFSLSEPKVELNDEREPIHIAPGKRVASYGWIEECMLLANQAAAKYLHQHKIPGLYRVHEQPDLEVVEELWMGQAMLAKNDVAREAFTALRETQGYLNAAVQNFYVRLLDPKQGALPPAVQRRVLQSMKKAEYDPEPLGHFALGWQYYAHFTSPIRRYADLWTHRMMKIHLRGEKPSRVLRTRALAVAGQVSERELMVLKVERKAMKVAMAWVFRTLVGREFVGDISGVEGFGVFVTVTNPYGEGMVPVARLRDDFYEFDPETRHLVGRRFRRRFELGQRIKIKVARSDPFLGQLDFEYLGPA